MTNAEHSGYSVLRLEPNVKLTDLVAFAHSVLIRYTTMYYVNLNGGAELRCKVKFDPTYNKRLDESVVGTQREKTETEVLAERFQQAQMRARERIQREKEKEKGEEHGGTQFGTELDADFVAGSPRSPATIVTQEKVKIEKVTKPEKSVPASRMESRETPEMFLLRSAVLRRSGPSSLVMTIPKEVIEVARLEEGDRLSVRVYKGGEVWIGRRAVE